MPPGFSPLRETECTEGPNFAVEVRPDGIGRLRVWRRPDLSRDEGARCAELMVGHMKRLAGCVRACILDMTKAPPTWGPVTHKAIGQMLEPWEAAFKPIFIVCPNEAISRILLRELQSTAAPSCAKLVGSHEAALAALAESGGK